METESSTAQTWHRRQYNLFPEKDRGSTYERRKNMKLNIKKFMMTEMGGELEETIKAWDQALEERRKATPGIGDPDQGLGFGYWDRTCKSCQDRWEVFKLAIRQFYGHVPCADIRCNEVTCSSHGTATGSRSDWFAGTATIS